LLKLFNRKTSLKKAPNQSDVAVDVKTQNGATLLLFIGVLFLLTGFVFTLVRIVFYSQLKIEVQSGFFWSLIASSFFLLGFTVMRLIALLNAFTDILTGHKEKKVKVIGNTLLSLLFSLYLTFFLVNEASLLGLYNDVQYKNICTVYLTSNEKSKECIEYEREMTRDTSHISRFLYFW
jgi:hypothetical protein